MWELKYKDKLIVRNEDKQVCVNEAIKQKLVVLVKERIYV